MDQYFFIILSLNTFTDVRIEEIQSVETCYVVCKNPIDWILATIFLVNKVKAYDPSYVIKSWNHMGITKTRLHLIMVSYEHMMLNISEESL